MDPEAEAQANAPSQEAEPALPEPDPRELEIARLQGELAARDRRVDEVLRAYAAAKNEQAEQRARLEREREQVLAVERGKLATAFLEAADELDRALQAAGDDASPLTQGVRLTREAMARQMAALGIEPVVTVGQPFDPNLAEAVDLVAVGDATEDGRVIGEVRRGYLLSGKLLRAARVRVGRFLPPPEVKSE